jgi:hypothetical protein
LYARFSDVGAQIWLLLQLSDYPLGVGDGLRREDEKFLT